MTNNNHCYPPLKYDSKTGEINKSYNEDLLCWAEDQIKIGDAFIKSQKAYKKAQVVMKILYGDLSEEKLVAGDSKLVLGKLRRILRELITTQSNIRPNWGYVSPSKDLEEQQFIKKLTLCFQSWWQNSFCDRIFKTASQYAMASNGYMYMFPKRNNYTKQWEVKVQAHGFEEYFPIGVTSSMDIQDAAGGILKLEMPMTEIYEMYPNHIDILNPTSNVPSWIDTKVKAVKKAFKGVVDAITRRREEKEKTELDFMPSGTVYLMWFKDNRINKTGKDLLMENGSGTYIVPSLYDKDGNLAKRKTGKKLFIETEEFNTNGEKIKKEVDEEVYLTEDECLFYSTMRYIVYYDSGYIIEDRPYNLWTQGLIPVFDIRYDDMPKQWLALTPINDALSPSEELNKLLRSILDAVNCKLFVPLGIDDKAPDDLKNNFNPRKAVVKIFKYPMRMLKDIVTTIIPADYYNIDPRAFEIIKILLDSMDYLTGIAGMQELAKARQTPSADTQEKYLENVGSLQTDFSRGLEKSLTRLGTVWAGLFLQFTKTSQLIKLSGTDNILETILDFDPNTLVPQKDSSDTRPRYERAKDFLSKLSFYAVPNSLHEMSSMSNKLTKLTLLKVGQPYSMRNIHETFFPNETDFERIKEEFWEDQKEKIIKGTELKLIQDAIAAKTLAQQQQETDVMNVLGAMQKNQVGVGRPPENRVPPQQQQKMRDGIPDVTTRTT